ncbi:MAG: hypothetical protein WB297_07990 [Actinomycetota bacterium]
MSEEADPDEGSTAHPGDEIAPSSPHADIVERLLEYQRRLQEESDMAAPTPERMPTGPPSSHADRIPVDSAPRGRAGSEPEPMPEPGSQPDAEPGLEPELRAEMEPGPEASTQMEPEPEAGPEPASPASTEPDSARPDVRQLRERIERLDETLARIAAMLPLLRGDDRDREP